MSVFFQIKKRSSRSKARIASITTSHGKVTTPAFVPVGTKGTIKALPQSFIKEIGIQLSFVNTYHLVTHPGVEILKNAGGIHGFAQYDIPLMSDSGGFQVFSLAQNKKKADQNLKGKKDIRRADIRGDEEPLVLKISEDGVKFRSVYDGAVFEFTPEKSMEYQRAVGADLMMTFDECTYYPATHAYAEKAMKRTHEWLKRCIAHKKSLVISRQSLKKEAVSTNNYLPSTNDQYLYGIIQGGTYKDLRIASAKFVRDQDVDGVAIGGVSVGESKKEMREQVRWSAPYLPDNKPVHLLGVGQIDDIVDLVGYGIDTFDCVEPTRLARMGTIYQYQTSNVKSQIDKSHLKSRFTQIDIQKSIYKSDLSPVNNGCGCFVCRSYTKGYLHHLFKQKEILGYTLATYHNLWVMEELMKNIREMILQGLI
ncbi:MAG: tRNA guanosine(34) transglycosylase Tgt [Patescibacteria group bacterium]